MANVEQLKARAKQLETKQNWRAAVACWAEVLAIQESGRDPEAQDLSLYNRLGDLYLKIGDPATGADYFERAVERYADSGFQNNAIALCNKVLRYAPGRTHVYLKLAKLMAKRGFTTEAKLHFLQYAERMQRSGQQDEAVSALRELTRIAPNASELTALLDQYDIEPDRLSRKTQEQEQEQEQEQVEPEYDVEAGAPGSDRRKTRSLVFLDVDEGPSVRGLPLLESARIEKDAAPKAAEPPPEPVPPEEKIAAPDAATEQQASAAALEPEDEPAATSEVTPPAGLESAELLDQAPDVGPMDIEPTMLSSEAADSSAVAPLEGLETREDVDETRRESGTIPLIRGFDVAEAGPPAATPLEGLEPTTIDEEETGEASFEHEGAAPEPADLLGEIAAAETVEEDSASPAGPWPAGPWTEGPSEAVPAERADEPGKPWEDAGVEAGEHEEAERAASESVDVGAGDVELDRPALDVSEDDAEALEAEEELEPVAEAEPPEMLGGVELVESSGAESLGSGSASELEMGLEGVTNAADTDETHTLQASGEEAGVDEATDSAGLIEVDEVDLEEAVHEAAPDITALEAAVLDDPDHPDPHLALGEALIETGDRERGLEELGIALGCSEDQGDLTGAREIAMEIVRLEPNDIRILQKLVEYAYRSGERGSLVSAYLELGDALFRTGAVTKALAVYERILEHDSQNTRALAALGMLRSPEEPKADAKDARLTIRDEAPSDAADYVDLGALILEEERRPRDTRMRIEDEAPTGDEARDFAEMLEQFRKGIGENLGDEDYQAHYDLGVAFKEMGLLDDAIAEFQKAMRGADVRLQTHEALGVCFYEKRQFSVAEAILRRGLDVGSASDEERIGILYWLARALEQQGELSEALSLYRRVFAVNIRFEDVDARVRTLGRAEVR